jgi:hypothetical protein
MQIDISNIGTAVAQAGYIDSSRIYNALRVDPSVMILEIDLAYQGTQNYQTIFNVNGISMILPDGRMQAFSLQQPAQLIIDATSYRIAMVTFPQMIDTFNAFYGGWQQGIYTTIAPVVFVQPVPIAVPVFVPLLVPIPIIVAPVPIPVPFFFGGPEFAHGFGGFFNNPFTPRVFTNQFAVASAAATAAAFGGNASAAASAAASAVSGGGGESGLFQSALQGPGLWTGGEFGPEASLITMLVATAAGIILVIIAARSGRMTAPSWRRQTARAA